MFMRHNPPLDDFNPAQEVDDDPRDPPAVMSKEEYLDCVRSGVFIDYDGFGHPAIAYGDGYREDQRYSIAPSMKGADIPPGATHINWFNR